MNKFDKTRNSNQQYDMISLFQSAQERTMRHLNVASLAKVKAVNGNNVVAMLFPKREGTDTIEINAYNLFNSAINVGDTILVVFTDRDFNVNLSTIRQGNDYVAETGDDDLHSLNNAVAIEITPFSKSELKLKTIDYQSIKGEGNIDLSLTYALKSNLENNYYTKSEINERLADDFYTKGEIDSKLNGKQNKATPLGNNITPVYIDSNGDFALCASYTNASVKHADSADTATNADNATFAQYLGEDGSTLQYSANDIKNGFNSKQDMLVPKDYINISGKDISVDLIALNKVLVPYKDFNSNDSDTDYGTIGKGDFYYDNDEQIWYISKGTTSSDLKKIVLEGDKVGNTANADYATHLGDKSNSYTYSQISSSFTSINNSIATKQDRVTALGNITTPVYVSKDGVLSACTPYSEAQVSYASEANYAVNASSANSSTFSNRLAKATDSGTYYTYENINTSLASLDGRITQNTNSLSSLKNVVNGTISYSVDLVEE